MKFLHLSDLHLGKRLNGYSLLEDQKYVLKQAVSLVKEKKPDAVVIAGDIYDSSIPNGDAVSLFSSFLTELDDLGIPSLIIPGNHDSADRLGFGKQIFRKGSIYISTTLDDFFKPVKVKDVNFYLLPYVTRSYLNAYFTGEVPSGFHSLSEGMSYLLKKLTLNKNEKNVLVMHQTVFPSKGKLMTGGSEEAVDINEDGEAVATSSTLNTALFSDFTYVALGHIHKKISLAPNIRYPGALLKYHQDEANQAKTFTVVDLSKENPAINEENITPLHDLVKIEGTYEELLSKENITAHKSDYVYFILDGEANVSDPFGTLKSLYPYALGFRRKNGIKKSAKREYKFSSDIANVNLNDLFSSFYEEVFGTRMDEEEKEYIAAKLEEMKGEKE